MYRMLMVINTTEMIKTQKKNRVGKKELKF